MYRLCNYFRHIETYFLRCGAACPRLSRSDSSSPSPTPFLRSMAHADRGIRTPTSGSNRGLNTAGKHIQPPHQPEEHPLPRVPRQKPVDQAAARSAPVGTASGGTPRDRSQTPSANSVRFAPLVFDPVPRCHRDQRGLHDLRLHANDAITMYAQLLTRLTHGVPQRVGPAPLQASRSGSPGRSSRTARWGSTAASGRAGVRRGPRLRDRRHRALELGIDVGDLDRVIQSTPRVCLLVPPADGPHRPAAGHPATPFPGHLDEGLLRATGLSSCGGRASSSGPRRRPVPLHILAQQILALAFQERGIGRSDWRAWVGQVPAFRDLDRVVVDRVLDGMLDRRILWDEAGVLWLGREGQDAYGRKNFLDLISVFTAPPLFVVLHGRHELGSVDESTFLGRRDDGPPVLLLAGRAWRVTHLDWKRRRATSSRPRTSGNHTGCLRLVTRQKGPPHSIISTNLRMLGCSLSSWD